MDDGSKIIYPSFGAQYAEIKIDSINLDAPVYWGDTEELLQQGVCQNTGSVYLGMKGNKRENKNKKKIYLSYGRTGSG